MALSATHLKGASGRVIHWPANEFPFWSAPKEKRIKVGTTSSPKAQGRKYMGVREGRYGLLHSVTRNAIPEMFRLEVFAPFILFKAFTRQPPPYIGRLQLTRVPEFTDYMELLSWEAHQLLSRCMLVTPLT